MAWHVPLLIPITDHFHTLEMVCRHCGQIPDQAAIEATAAFLEEVREFLGNRPVHILSAVRCAQHNAAVGGAPESYHLRGMAADITVRGLSPRQVQKELKKIQGAGKLIGGLGSYSWGTHCDRGPARRWNGP